MSLFTYICACIHCSWDPYAATCFQFWLFINKYSEFLQSRQQSPANVKTSGFEQLLVLLIGFLWWEKMRNQEKEQLLELSSSACSNLIFKSWFSSQEERCRRSCSSQGAQSAFGELLWSFSSGSAHWDKQWELCMHHLSSLITTKWLI